MRIAYVTAHLPPDFTSGATLLVERLAVEAARQGHDVEVFSGAIHQRLADGELRRDPATDERPFTTHWIGTASRVEQDVDGNWDNPLAAAAVAAWLAEFEPDVVHMHALQTLGVGVVDAAVACGAHTVVTMHDLWWWCARLFLVDTELRPCPLVADVGTCPCARNASWRRGRADRLIQALDGVGTILTPSAVLRDVVIANGVDPARVVVDENHVADAVADAVATPIPRSEEPPNPNTTVRFLYLGGDSPLKGADVMRSAAAQLYDLDGWRLDAYGLAATSSAESTRMHLRPPFDPGEVGDVMAAHDVLVIPSIARESFSIAAREALAAGLAVITSDCLGPEEVVSDGHNGLVVPTGDAGALAEAMRVLVSDSTLLARLRDGARGAPGELRRVNEHVSSLVERYRTSPRVSPTSEPPRVGFVVCADGAPARSRLHHLRAALTLRGGELGPIAHHRHPHLQQLLAPCDVILVQQPAAGAGLDGALGSWRSSGRLVIADIADITDITGITDLVDDSTRVLDDPDTDQAWWTACFDGAICGSAAGADMVAAATGLTTTVVADAAGLVELQLADQANVTAHHRRSEAPVRLGVIADASDPEAALAAISPALSEVLARHVDVEVLVFAGADIAGPGSPMESGDRVRVIAPPPWRQMTSTLLGTVDVVLAPSAPVGAHPSPGTGLAGAWLDASMVGVPTIASPGLAEVIDHRGTAIVCDSPDEWVAALEHMITSPVQRASVGAAARREVELRHGPHVTACRYLDAFSEFAQRRSHRASVGPVAPDTAERAPTSASDDTESVPQLAPYDLGGIAIDARVANRSGDGTAARTVGERVVGGARRAAGRVARRVRAR